MMGLICGYSYCKFLNYKWETCILKQRVCIKPRKVSSYFCNENSSLGNF